MIVRARTQGHRHLRRCRRRSKSAPTSIRSRKFVGLNERTCQNQKPIVQVGEKVEKGAGDRRRRRHVSRASWPWAATCWSASWPGTASTSRTPSSSAKSWCKNDTYTSIHIEEFDIEIRETKLGREEFTRDIPNVSEKALRNLDENGIVRDRHLRSARRHSGGQGFAQVARPS